MKTAEGAKASVAQQVQLGLLDVNQKQCSCDYYSVQCAVNEMNFQRISGSTVCPFATLSKVTMLCLQEMMPLQYLYTMALEQDIKNSLTSRKTSELIQARCYQVWIHSYIQKI